MLSLKLKSCFLFVLLLKDLGLNSLENLMAVLRCIKSNKSDGILSEYKYSIKLQRMS